MEAWVIKATDCDNVYWGEYGWTSMIWKANFYPNKDKAMGEIEYMNLHDYVPVEVRIEEVEE